jgi:hypothetical protein
MPAKRPRTGAAPKEKWSADEDASLRSLVGARGLVWPLVAAGLPGRTSKQCRARWCNHLDPAVNRGPWAPAEDAHVVRLVEKLGTRWSGIARELARKGFRRTDMNIKNRYNTVLRDHGAARSGGGGGGGADGGEDESSDVDESESGGDVDVAGESVYCLCRKNDSGHGLMIGCDGASCEIEWFHFSCVGLVARPAGDWYCPSCTASQASPADAPSTMKKSAAAAGSAQKGAGAQSRARARAVAVLTPAAAAAVADAAVPVSERFLYLRDTWWRVTAGGLVNM